MKKTNSKKIFCDSKLVMVGGVNSPVRAFKSVGGEPLVMSHGKGSKLFDVDANSYTDYCLSWGSLILGHAHQDVLTAIRKSIKCGVSFGATTKPELEIAKFITKHVPSVDMVRFVNSGTEATMSAVRLARGFTKRNKILKFDGCYHGHCDDLLATAGSGVSSLAASSSQGVPSAHIQDTLSIPYNDIQELGIIIERYAKDIACVILEPVAGNMGVILPDKSFLKVLRELTKKYGIVLIYDEVMTGFRTNLGCVQADLGIIPDMTCMGKIIGGGFPVGAYGGRRDIMRQLAPLGGVYQAGTFSGTPVVMAAGLATLKNLNASFYKDIAFLADNFVNNMNAYFKQGSFPVHLVNYKGMISIRFSRECVNNYAQARAAASDEIYSKLFHYLLNNGVYWPPADLEAFFVSSAHRTNDFVKLEKILKGFFK